MIASNYPGLTPEASEMLKHQYGFRTDAQSAVSLESISAHDILNYEINELQNDDIPDGFEMPFIDVYEVHPDDALISDPGVDGQLIANKHLPQPMHGFNY